MKIQVETALPNEANVVRLVGGEGVTLTATEPAGDTADLVVTIDADAETAELTAITDRLTAIEGDGSAKVKRITFTETAGAGIYTGQVTIPAGGVIHSVAWETSVAWGADTTVLDVGYTGTLTAYGNDIDIDATGGDQVFGLDTEDPDDFAAGTVFNAVVTTTGAGTTAGRSAVTLVYSVPPTATAATKA
jgi:hypothetical protein